MALFFLEENTEVYQQDLILVENLFVSNVVMNFFLVQLYGNIRSVHVFTQQF